MHSHMATGPKSHMKTSIENQGRRRMGLVLCAGVLAMAGCRGDRSDKPPRQFFPDMDDSPKWKAQTESEFFADGRSMRHPVAGTVAFGRVSFVSEEAWAGDFGVQRRDLLKEGDGFYRGVDPALPAGTPAEQWVERIPVPVTEAMIRRGQERFNIYCSVCHGYSGNSQGMVGRRWSAAPANFHDPKYTDVTQRTGRDGYIFNVIRNGVPAVVEGQPPRMPGYGHALNETDAWSVVAYVRALQQSRRGTMEDVPAEQRSAVEAARQAKLAEPAPAPAEPATPPAGSTP